MKNIFLIVLVNLLFVSNLDAQNISFGIEGGANISDVEVSGLVDFSSNPTTNYFVGFTSILNTSSKIKFAADVNYSLKGYQSDIFYLLNESETLKSRFSYLVVNPMILLEANNKLDIGIGGYYGSKLGEKHKLESTGWYGDEEEGLIKSSDYGITGMMKIKIQHFFIKGAYEWGIQSIHRTFTDENGLPLTTEYNNRNIRIGLGYMIN